MKEKNVNSMQKISLVMTIKIIFSCRSQLQQRDPTEAAGMKHRRMVVMMMRTVVKDQVMVLHHQPDQVRFKPETCLDYK